MGPSRRRRGCRRRGDGWGGLGEVVPPLPALLQPRFPKPGAAGVLTPKVVSLSPQLC